MPVGNAHIVISHCPVCRIPYRSDRDATSLQLPLCLELSSLGDDVTGSRLLLNQLLAFKTSLGGNDHLYVLVSYALTDAFSYM